MGMKKNITKSQRIKLYIARIIMLPLCIGFFYVSWMKPIDESQKQVSLAGGNINLSITDPNNTTARVISKMDPNNSPNSFTFISQKTDVQEDIQMASLAGDVSGLIPSENIKSKGNENMRENQENVEKNTEISTGKPIENHKDKKRNPTHAAQKSTSAILKGKQSQDKKKGKKSRTIPTIPKTSHGATTIGLGQNIRERIGTAMIVLHFAGPADEIIMKIGGVDTKNLANIHDKSVYAININGMDRFFGVTVVSENNDKDRKELILPAAMQHRIFNAIAEKTDEILKNEPLNTVTKAQVWLDNEGEILKVHVEFV